MTLRIPYCINHETMRQGHFHIITVRFNTQNSNKNANVCRFLAKILLSNPVGGKEILKSIVKTVIHVRNLIIKAPTSKTVLAWTGLAWYQWYGYLLIKMMIILIKWSNLEIMWLTEHSMGKSLIECTFCQEGFCSCDQSSCMSTKELFVLISTTCTRYKVKK